MTDFDARSLSAWRLRRKLDALERRFGARYLATDPVELVRGYRQKRDLEVAGVIAAGYAVGNAVAVRASTRRLLDRLGPEPASTIQDARGRQLAKLVGDARHRWIGPEALCSALRALADAQREHGDLEAAFLHGDDGDPEHLEAAMAALVATLPALQPFFSSPRSGSACKRFCLFLRWMVRAEDGIDLGVWRAVSPSRLTVPLDVHVSRVGRRWMMTSRRTDDWKTAREITAALRRADPGDPLRYDFALCRVGMMEGRDLPAEGLTAPAATARLRRRRA